MTDLASLTGPGASYAEDAGVASTARAAVEGCQRGVVAFSSLV